MIAESDQIAEMAGKTDEAMAELEQVYESFRNPHFVLQGSPTVDLSAESTNSSGFMFPNQARRNSENAMPNPERTGQDQAGTTPVNSERQRTKRKARDDEVESFQHGQLDFERQEPRPPKRVKSVQVVHSGVHHHDTEYSFQRQPQVFPQPGGYQPSYSQKQNCGQPAQHAFIEDEDLYNDSGSYQLQNAGTMRQYPNAVSATHQTQHYPPASFGVTFPDEKQCTGSPYQSTSAMSDWTPSFESSGTLLGDPVGNFPSSDIQTGQGLGQLPSACSATQMAQPADN